MFSLLQNAWLHFPCLFSYFVPGVLYVFWMLTLQWLCVASIFSCFALVALFIVSFEEQKFSFFFFFFFLLNEFNFLKFSLRAVLGSRQNFSTGSTESFLYTAGPRPAPTGTAPPLWTSATRRVHLLQLLDLHGNIIIRFHSHVVEFSHLFLNS